MNVDKVTRFIKHHEGFRGRSYLNSQGKLSLGYGHPLETKAISKKAAQMILDDSIDDAIADLNKNLPWFHFMSENRQDALIIMTVYNGINGVLKFKKMLKSLEEGDYKSAYEHVLESLYAKQYPDHVKDIALAIKNG